MIVVNNMDLFVINFDKYTTVTKDSSNLYFPLSNLTIFQKGPQYFGVKVYNNLPGSIKQLSSDKNQFRKALLQFLYLHSFYSIEEFFKRKDKYICKLILVGYIDNNVHIVDIVTILLYYSAYNHKRATAAKCCESHHRRTDATTP
jgi:hypothetical protein